MMMMSQVRANSSPDSVRPSTSITEQQYDDSALQGVAASIKLLLKLTQDHKDACDKEKNGSSRRMLRVATMMTILDNIRDRIQKCQSFGNKGSSRPELRRWNTIPRTYNNPTTTTTKEKDDRQDNENERLTRELTSCFAAQRNLQGMCSSLGREKEIMAAELSRKVQELSGMEELINDLKAQNETLLVKVRKCASEHNNKEKKCSGSGSTIGELQLTTALQERNRALSEQLLKSLDGYRSMKRKLQAAEEEKGGGMRATMDEMRVKVVASLERIRSLKERIVLPSAGDNSTVDVKEEIVSLESMFECFRMLVMKHDRKQPGDCVQHKAGEISAYKPSVVA
ncbi:hypothetical protein OROHE_010220 [Orobanche hederae]